MACRDFEGHSTKANLTVIKRALRPFIRLNNKLAKLKRYGNIYSFVGTFIEKVYVSSQLAFETESSVD